VTYRLEPWQLKWLHRTLRAHAWNLELAAVNDRGDLVSSEAWQMANLLYQHGGVQMGEWS
jgi:hypothetical protein